MPRQAKPEHPELPFEATEATPGDAPEKPYADAEPPTGRMGRPRKWESEADRKRAYRERLATDLAEPERLRRELRNARRRVADRDRRLAEAERDLARAQAEIERRSTRVIELEGTVRRLEAKVDDWRARANALARNLEAERAKIAQLVAIPPTPRTRSSHHVPPTKRTTPKQRRKRT